MTTPKDTLWECAPHTRAKHEILRRYLQAWFPILSKHHRKVVYMDGFAGPGAYIGGEIGSPLVALDVARNHSARLEGNICFLFVENHSKRHNHLKHIVSEQTYPKNFEIEIREDEFSTVLKEELDHLDETGSDNAPVFAFIDPFGFSGLPLELLARLLKRPRTEIFILFARDAVNRWLNTESVANHMADLFGLDAIEIPADADRVEYLRALYEEQLREIANYVGCFTMQDQQNRPIYDLFFASNNKLGFVKMKEAMWSVDDSGAFRFSDAKNPDQMILFRHDPIPTLANEIYVGGDGRKDINVDRIQNYVESHTIYLSKHMKAALRQLEEAGKIYVHPIKADGKQRRRPYFAPQTVIDFI